MIDDAEELHQEDTTEEREVIQLTEPTTQQLTEMLTALARL